MARAQIGNLAGVTAVGPQGPAFNKITDVAVDGANTFTTFDPQKFKVGQQIIFRIAASGAVFGSTARTVTGITSGGVVTYDGADLALVPGTHIVCSGTDPVATTLGADDYTDLNGGPSASEGFDVNILGSIGAMRRALNVADSGYYTTARMDLMTMNDLVYACRQKFYPASIR